MRACFTARGQTDWGIGGGEGGESDRPASFFLNGLSRARTAGRIRHDEEGKEDLEGGGFRVVVNGEWRMGWLWWWCGRQVAKAEFEAREWAGVQKLSRCRNGVEEVRDGVDWWNGLEGWKGGGRRVEGCECWKGR